jgi:hypothetical protein
MVLLNPVPLNILNMINIIRKKYDIQNYIIHLYNVNFTDRIVGFFEKNRILEKDNPDIQEKIQKVLIVLWQNELDPNPFQKLVTINFYYLKTSIVLEILQIIQINKHNFELYSPTSANRYVYNLNTHLFKEYEILCGRLYHMSSKSNTEIVYYKDD